MLTNCLPGLVKIHLVYFTLRCVPALCRFVSSSLPGGEEAVTSCWGLTPCQPDSDSHHRHHHQHRDLQHLPIIMLFTTSSSPSSSSEATASSGLSKAIQSAALFRYCTRLHGPALCWWNKQSNCSLAAIQVPAMRSKSTLYLLDINLPPISLGPSTILL